MSIPENLQSGPLSINSVPGEWLPLNQEMLGLVRPPITEYMAGVIANGLAIAGLQNCGDVLDQGLLGLSRTGLQRGEMAVVIGLVRALTNRDIPVLPREQ